MRKPTIKTSFWTLTDSAFDAKAMCIIIAMNSSKEYFPAPTPAIETISNVREQYSKALAKTERGNRLAASIKNGLREQLTELLMQLSNYIKTVATNKTMLEASGFDMAGDGSTSVLGSPRDTKLSDGKLGGELTSKCKIVKGAKGYGHQYTQAPMTADSVWTEKFSTRSKYTFKNLKSECRYWCRIRIIGSNNQERLSNPVSRVVQ